MKALTRDNLNAELARLHATVARVDAGITKMSLRKLDDTRTAIDHVNAQLTDLARLELVSANLASGNTNLALHVAQQITTSDGRNACAALLRDAHLPGVVSPVERQRAFFAMSRALDHEQRAAGQEHHIWYTPCYFDADMHIVAGRGTPCGWLRIQPGLPMWVDPYQGTAPSVITHELLALRKLAREWTEHIISRVEGATTA